MTNVLNAIEGNGYAATDKQIEQLAHIASDGSRAGGTYLRILVACTQASVAATRTKPARASRNNGGAASAQIQLEAFEGHHLRMYGIIAGVLAVPDDPRESNRRGTFARSAASTLRTWLRAGGDIGTLDARTVTKASLRAAPDPHASAAAAVDRATSTLAHRLEQLSDEARSTALDALAALIEEYRPRVVATQLTRTRRRAEHAAH